MFVLLPSFPTRTRGLRRVPLMGLPSLNKDKWRPAYLTRAVPLPLLKAH